MLINSLNIIYHLNDFNPIVVQAITTYFIVRNIALPNSFLHNQLICILVGSRIDFIYIQQWLTVEEQDSLLEEYWQFFSDWTLYQYIQTYGFQLENPLLNMLCAYYLDLHNNGLLGWDLTPEQISAFTMQLINSGAI